MGPSSGRVVFVDLHNRFDESPYVTACRAGQPIVKIVPSLVMELLHDIHKHDKDVHHRHKEKKNNKATTQE